MRSWYPIVTTPALAECRDYYQRAFDARVLFSSDWYLHIRISGLELGFLRPNPPARLPVFQHTSQTRGLCLAVEVEDVDVAYAELQRRGMPVLGAPQRYAGGERAFTLVDPAGTVLNVVERHGAPLDPAGS